MNKKYLILDSNYLCHRAKHSTGNLSFNGEATGIVYGFLVTVLSLQERFDNTHFIFCWDSKFSERKKVLAGYKESRNHRQDEMTKKEIRFEEDFRLQMKKLRKVYLKEIGFKNVFCQKGYEADDLIASVCQNMDKTDEAVIVSSDHDLYQLLAFNVKIYSPNKKQLITLQSFTKEYGIRPVDWITVKALAGCSSDEIPGIKGVGEKTAIKFIKETLKKTSKAYDNIDKGFKILLRNLVLVKLPFKGTRIFKIKEDEVVLKGWKKVTVMLGMKSLKHTPPFFRKRL